MDNNLLQIVLASTYSMYLKSQNYHWNVEGESFYSLHLLFENHYTQLAMAVDKIAEKIRFLGYKASGTYETFLKLSIIKSGNENFSAHEMVKDLQESHVKMIELLNKALKEFRDNDTIQDLLIERRDFHEQASWMLSTILK